MKKKMIWCLAVAIIIILSYFYAHIDKNSYIYDRNVDTKNFYSTGLLVEDEDMTQTFISEEDVIDGIYIKISVVGNVEDVIMHYSLTDNATNKVVSAVVKASELENNKFNRLAIPKIEGAKGKTFTLTLSTENADAQNGIGFYLTPGRFNGQTLVVKGNETDGTIVARTLCHRFDVETFVVLLGMIAFVSGFMKVLYKFFR